MVIILLGLLVIKVQRNSKKSKKNIYHFVIKEKMGVIYLFFYIGHKIENLNLMLFISKNH